MKLKHNVCTDTSVNGVRFTVNLVVPSGLPNARTLEKMKSIDNIVVHNTGNPAPTAGDEAHANYLQGVENADETYLSWHITVDEDSATQHLPFDEVGFHAGDGQGPGNRRSIGIEIAENKNYAASEENGIKLICALMHDYNIPVSHVLPHRYFSSIQKLCPWRILKSQKTWKSDWVAFQKHISIIYNSLYGSEATPPPTVSQPNPPIPPVFNVGDIVTFVGGKVYRSSDAQMTAITTTAPASLCKVTATHKGRHPFHCVSEDGKGVYGWVDASAISDMATALPKIAVGSTVRIVGTRYTTGQTVPSWVKSTTHTVSRIEGTKALLGATGGICSWVNLSDLTTA